MGNLRRLRHLYLPDWKVHSLGKKAKLRFDGLSKLETLENFNSDWCEVKDLPKLTSLRKLVLRVDNSCDHVEEMMKYLTAIALSATSCLQYLVLTVCECDLGSRNGPDILRKLLSDHKYNLRELKLIGQLPELAQLFEQQLQNTHTDVSLIHITRLHLMVSCLEEDPMPVLEKIQTLRELLLHRKAFMGQELVCSAIGFPKLTHLVLRNLPNFMKWRVEEGSMPVLSHLMIRNCPKLEELPEGIKIFHSLQELRVEVMPLDFYKRLRVVNGAKYSIIVDID
ncbi:putative disease resistance protein RF9 [Apium graveolens]|uniref:putative disease resistance protein RF9 n=1 Tax=Apium graveolens TaxID=4045 RepID=UPI003D79A398